MALAAIVSVICSTAAEVHTEAALYSAYEQGQSSKLDGKGNGTLLPGIRYILRFDAGTERDLVAHLQRQEVRPHVGSPVLCVGARLGGEVRAFQTMDEVDLAIGVDVNPGEKNQHVMYGDAHDLRQFKPRTFGTVYSNVLDHILRVEAFANATHRLLRPNGTLFIDMPEQPLCKDAWAVHDLVHDRGSLECEIALAGFELIWHMRGPVRFRGREVGNRHRYIFRRLAWAPTITLRKPAPEKLTGTWLQQMAAPVVTGVRVGGMHCEHALTRRPSLEKVSCLISNMGDLEARKTKCGVPVEALYGCK